MIIAEIVGGLGNQMFQYATARALALHHDVELLLDRSAFDAYALRSFRLPAWNIGGRIGSFPEPSRTPFLLGRFGLRKDGILCIEERKMKYRPQLATSRPPLRLKGYWQNERYFLGARETLLQDFTPAEPGAASVETWKREIGRGPSVSIHVRRGDYASNPQTLQVHGLMPLSYYQSAAQLFLERNPRIRFFVFSDDPSWCAQNLNIGGETVVVSGSDLREIDEMLLMAACDHQIIANSSFSWWAAWLNRSTSKTVIAPKKWFADPSLSSEGIVPASWVRL